MTVSSDKSKKLCFLSIDDNKISYTLTRSRRRTIQIAIKDSCEVQVSAPRYLSYQDIEGFILKKSNWVLRKLAEQRLACANLQKRRYTDGQQFLFLGKKYPVRVAERDISKSMMAFDNNQWNFDVPQGVSPLECELLIKDNLMAWYQDQAKEVLGMRLLHFARRMALHPRKIVIKTQKHLWGSCNYKKKSIHLNWRLILSPMDVIDYVVVHELCHLFVPNHSKRFWQKVAEILPDFNKHRQWLKENAGDMMLP